ncbi:MAG: DUF1775 domain-containing protein [Hyphomicrobium sp.]
MKSVHLSACALAIIVACCEPASAHVVLERRETAIGQSYKAVFKVTHGCEGSPTQKVTIQFPEGVIAVKPMPKPGWQIATTKTAYENAYQFYHGSTLKEGVTRVVWSGGSLPDDFYDEFVVSAFIAGELQPGAALPFTVTQDCEKGQMRWSETGPEEHQHHLKWPAPVLKLLAPQDHSKH